MKMEKVSVLIVGSGPSGIATSACLTKNSISHVILEKEDCCASLWKKNTYDRVNLHLAKEFCALPYMPHPPSAPTFLTKKDFINYIDKYTAHFDIKPRFCRLVESATYNESTNEWKIEAKNITDGTVEVFVSKFLVVATGENSEGCIPDVPGLGSFAGEVIHSKYYKSGAKFQSKDVLVVGSGNSGMEIAYDLDDWGARVCILARSPFHVLTKELVHKGMSLLQYLPIQVVDDYVVSMANLAYGDLSSFGIHRPKQGPFYIKEIKGRSPVLDVGTIARIKEGAIKVIPAQIRKIEDKNVIFENMTKKFDAIVFATGYKSTANTWLEDYKYILNNDGMPKNAFPEHWKGENGLYCAGLSRRGLFGVAMDAQAIANDINKTLYGAQCF